MRVLFDLGHPAHYHLYKNAIKYLKTRNDDILIVVRNRENMVADLLREDGENFVILGENVKGLTQKSLYLVRNDIKLLQIASKFRPDLFVSMSSPYSSHIAFLLRRPHLSFTDTEISKLILFLLAPFTKPMITPTSFTGEFNFRKHIKIDSYKELAYLHPKYFEPDPGILENLDLRKGEKYMIVRFSAFDASHDTGLKGLTTQSKIELVKRLTEISKVFICSEVTLPDDLRDLELQIPPGQMHNLLGHAALYIGEGAVMASEAALLGIPSIFLNPSKRGYLEELKQMGLVTHYMRPEEELDDIFNHVQRIISSDSVKEDISKRREEMLIKKKDLTALLISEIEKIRLRTGKKVN